MPVARKTTISFSLVAIPVSLYTATQDNDIRFHQLHEADGQRIRYKKVCGHCGKEVAMKDIVKGYEYDKGQFVTVTDAEIEKIKTPKERTIEILHFATLQEISPVYYDRTFQAAPEAGGEKAFELLRRSLYELKKIAVGKAVFGASETLLCIIPREEGLLIQTMYYEAEVKELQKSYKTPTVSAQELTMAKKLIEAMDQPFEPESYTDEYQDRLRELIEAKIGGRKIVAQKAPKPKVINLMDALKQSVAEAGKPAAKKSSTKKAAAKKAASPKSPDKSGSGAKKKSRRAS